MKYITLHSDYIKFKPLKKALKSIELKKGEEKEKYIEEPLVVLTAIEESDSKDLVEKFVESIEEIASQVKAENIVLYPYAHLSSSLAKPEIAMEILDEVKEKLKKIFKKVEKAPFGYYKEFELKVKGHPLSELSREIKNEKEESEENVNIKQILREIGKQRLDTSKLKENDHRILGQKMDLFSFSEVAPGMVFWHDKGLTIFEELKDYWKEEHKKENYKLIQTPQIMESKLWKVSGHWDKYKENNFITSYENKPFLVKPMNCPGGMLVYKNSSKSYKDLPLRMGEIGVVHRTELSGVLSGLFRAVQFTQDDAHIFCANEKQVESELKDLVNLINKFYNKFDLEFDHVELSTRPEKRIGSDKNWDMAEKILEKTLKDLKMKYKINKGDGAFYGPKIDFHVKDSQKRTWQLSTIQLDFSLPERFDLNFNDKNDKKQRPIMLHRVIYGSFERFIGILLEHTRGALPTWLAPVQVRVINYTDRNIEYCEKVIEKLKKEIPHMRVDKDFESVPLGGKIREAEIQKIPYIIVIGDKEEENESLAVRRRGSKKIEQENVENFTQKVGEEIWERL